jgi:hypothetical protein
MNIIYYTNCQGDKINKFFKLNSDDYNNKINNITILYNWYYKDDLPILKLNECDIFIYNPVKECHGIYNTYNNNGIIKYLKKNCIKICIPSLYIDGIWPIYEEGGYYVGGEYILNLKIKKDYTLNEIIELYKNGLIDFNLKDRYNNCISYLKSKEEICDIKISDFIENNIFNKELFYTQNHPSNILIKEMCYRINNILLYKFNNIIHEIVNDSNIYFMSSYSIVNYNNSIINNDYYLNIIELIYNGSVNIKEKYKKYIDNMD